MFMPLGTAVRVQHPPVPPTRRLGPSSEPIRNIPKQSEPNRSNPNQHFFSSLHSRHLHLIYNYLHLAPNRTWFEPQTALPFHLHSLTFTYFPCTRHPPPAP